MKAAPPIIGMTVSDNALEVIFEGFAPRIIRLDDIQLLGKAKELLRNPVFLRSFMLIDGIPNWYGEYLIGPEDLFAAPFTEAQFQK